jgi:hypothetical protein
MDLGESHITKFILLNLVDNKINPAAPAAQRHFKTGEVANRCELREGQWPFGHGELAVEHLQRETDEPG